MSYPDPISFRLFPIGEQPYKNLYIPKFTAFSMIFAYNGPKIEICRPDEYDIQLVHLDGTRAFDPNRLQRLDRYPISAQESLRSEDQLLAVIGTLDKFTITDGWVVGHGRVKKPLHWGFPKEDWAWYLNGHFDVKPEPDASGRRIVKKITPTEVIVDYWSVTRMAISKYRKETGRELARP